MKTTEINFRLKQYCWSKLKFLIEELCAFKGPKKYDVKLTLPPHQAGDALCVRNLSEAVFKLTEIPEEAQRLIFKGKSLKDPSQELLDVGLKNGAKVMLIGKKPSAQDDENTQTLNTIENAMEKLGKKLSEATYELDGIHRGYLSKELQVDAVKQKEKQMAGFSESLMKLLEKLDAVTFDETNKGGRGRRKTMVNKVQVLLDRVDGLSRGLRELLEREPE